MSAHTPGPWRWAPCNPGKFELVAGIERVLFRDWGNLKSGVVEDIDPSSPDARLIAAAPDLLAALKDVMRSCRRDFTTDAQGECDFRNAYAEQIAAIAKAEGRE